MNWNHEWRVTPHRARPAVLARPVASGEGAEGALGTMGVEHTITRALSAPRWSWAYKREAEHFLSCVRLFEEIYRQWLGK